MSYTARDWPALMDLQTAADYLALAPGSLVGLLRREGIFPVELGARLRRWRRSDLDIVVERLPHRWVERQTSCKDDDIGVDCALAAVERRIEARRRASGGRAHEVRQSHSPA